MINLIINKSLDNVMIDIWQMALYFRSCRPLNHNNTFVAPKATKLIILTLAKICFIQSQLDNVHCLFTTFHKMWTKKVERKLIIRYWIPSWQEQCLVRREFCRLWFLSSSSAPFNIYIGLKRGEFNQFIIKINLKLHAYAEKTKTKPTRPFN